MQDLWTRTKESQRVVSPASFVSQVQLLATLFASGLYDTHEFLRHLLEGLHEDVIMSKFADLFIGQLRFTLRCTVCGHASVTFDPLWDLSLLFPGRRRQLLLQACFDLFVRKELWTDMNTNVL